MVWVFSGIELVHFPSMEAVAPAPEEPSKCFRNALIKCLKSLGLLTNNPTIHFPPPPNKKYKNTTTTSTTTTNNILPKALKGYVGTYYLVITKLELVLQHLSSNYNCNNFNPILNLYVQVIEV